MTDIYSEYLRGKDFKDRMAPKSQYSLVDECSAFYAGDQWRGIPQRESNPTPVLNVERIIVNRKVAEIRPYSVSARYRVDSLPFDHPAAEYVSTAQDVLNGIAAAKWNSLGMSVLSLNACTQAAVQGTGVAYTYWDESFETFSGDAAEKVKGDFRTELIPAVNLYLGSPNSQDVQSQPYIIIAVRKSVEDIKALAKANGKNSRTLEQIVSDTDYETQTGENKYNEPGDEKTSRALLLYRFHKKDGKVYCSCATREVEIYKDRDLMLTKYPIAVFLWSKLDSLGYGIPECWDIHKNQIAINKAMGACIKNLLLTGAPKMLYDEARIPKWTNLIGGAQPVNGAVSDVARFVDPPRMGSESIQIVQYLYKQTLEMKGISDSLMGTGSSNSAKALALSQAQAVQFLKLEQEQFYQFIRDLFSVWLDFIVNRYDVDRIIRIPNAVGDEHFVGVRGALFRDFPISVSVDVGTGGEWNELSMSESVLEMVTAGHLDPVAGFEMLPSSYFANKEKTLASLRARQQEVMQQTAMMKGGENAAQGLPAVVPDAAQSPTNGMTIDELMTKPRA